MELLLQSLEDATEVNRRLARDKLIGGAELTQRELEIIQKLTKENTAAFAAEIEKAAKATQNFELLKLMATRAGAYAQSYVDLIDTSGLPVETATKLKDLIKVHIDNEIRQQQEGVARNKDLDGLRIKFLKGAWEEERRWARALEAAAKKHGIAMERLSTAARQITSGHALISKLVSVLKLLGAGALGVALRALQENSAEIVAYIPSLRTAAAIGVGTYATRTLGRRVAARPDVVAFTNSLAEVTTTVMDTVTKATRRLKRVLTAFTERFNSIMTQWSEWFNLMGFRSLGNDLRQIEEYATQGIQEAQLASEAAEEWLQHLPANVVQQGWERAKAEKAKILTRIDVAISKMRLASEARLAFQLRLKGTEMLGIAGTKFVDLTLRNTIVPKLATDRGTQIDMEVETWMDNALRPAFQSVAAVKQRLNQMEAIVNEFQDILVS